MNICAAPAPDGTGFVAGFCSYFSDGNNAGGLYVQKVNKEGELMWGDDAKAVWDRSMDYSFVVDGFQPDNSGNIAMFYEKSTKTDGLSGWLHYQNHIRLLNAEGNNVWEKETILNDDCHVRWAVPSRLDEPAAWVVTWMQGSDTDPQSTMLAQMIDFDGNIVDESGVAEIAKDAEGVSLAWDGKALRVNAAEGASVKVYTLDGTLVGNFRANGSGNYALPLAKGVYAVKAEGTAGAATLKIAK